MNKFLLVLVFLLFIGCGKEDMPDAPENQLPDGSINMGEEIAEQYGLYPVDADKIARFYLYEDKDGSKYLYGSKENENGKENFWFSKYDTDGQSTFDIVNNDKQFASHAYGPVQLSNGNIVVNNVLKIGEYEIKGSSPVIINQEGDAKFVDTKDNYYYSDVLLYDDFFFTIISDSELNKVSFASNCSYQIDNSGNVMRFFPGGTDELQLPKEGDNYIWLSDSTYSTISKERVSKIGISKMMSGWDFPVELPSHNSCEMSLAMEDTTILASYLLTYDDLTKDTISYRLSPSTGEEINDIEEFYLSETEKTLKTGEEFTLYPIFVPSNATRVINWSSSNESIATVDENGKVKAISAGGCIIKAVLPDETGFEAECHITVEEQNIEDLIKVNAYGSYTSLNGFVTGNVIAAFYNNSDKRVKVINFKVYNTLNNKIIFEQNDNTYVEYRNPLKHELSFSMVYEPLFVWEYEFEGKTYTVSCGI